MHLTHARSHRRVQDMVKRVAGLLIAVLAIPACDTGEEGGDAPPIPQPLSTTVSGYRYYVYQPEPPIDIAGVEAAIEIRVEEWIASRAGYDVAALVALAQAYPIIIFPGPTIPTGTDAGGAGYCWWGQVNQQIHVAWQPTGGIIPAGMWGVCLPALVHELDHALLGAYH